MAHHVGGVDHGALGALDFHGIADIKGRQVARDVACGIAFDDEVEVAGFDIGGDGGVGSYDFLAVNLRGLGVGHVEGCGEGDVLTDGKAEDAVLGGQLEAVNGGVVGDLGLLGDGEGLELVRLEDGGV